MTLSQAQAGTPEIRLRLVRPLVSLRAHRSGPGGAGDLRAVLLQAQQLHQHPGSGFDARRDGDRHGGGDDRRRRHRPVAAVNAAFSAVLGAMYMRATHDPIGGPLAMIVSALAIGTFNGVAVGYLRMIPFVVTLAMMTVANGAAVWLTNSISIADIPAAFVDPFFTRYLGIPLSVYIAIAVSILAYVLMSMTVYGRWLYAVGINAKAATRRPHTGQGVIALSYVFAGLIAGIAAIMLTGRLASASSNLASPTLVLDVVSACVVGGISVYGGVGKVYGAILGALFMTLLSNALNAAEVTVYVNQMVRGAIIVVFVAFDHFTARGK